MRVIKKLDRDQLRAALSIAAKAYPVIGLTSEQKLDEFENRIQDSFEQSPRQWYGLFEDGKLLGSMVLYDFTLNYYGQDISARGIGFVAVEFLHKKQKVCRDMLHWYLTAAHQQKYPVAILYAFRPDFYRQMGFGYGTACYLYKTSPDKLSRSRQHYQIEYLSVTDLADVTAFYASLYHQNHGMIRKNPPDIEAMLKTPNTTVAGYRQNSKLTALLTFGLISAENSGIATDIKLELLFTTPEGLAAALSFLSSQTDQVREISFSTLQKDLFFRFDDIRHNDLKVIREPGFHHIHDTGMGLMYRSLHPVELLKGRPCSLDNMRIRFQLTDTFLDVTGQEFIILWKQGRAALSTGKKYDLELSMNVAEFSAWIFNAIDLTTLYQYGLLQISDASYLPDLDRAFYYQQKPVCLERF